MSGAMLTNSANGNGFQRQLHRELLSCLESGSVADVVRDFHGGQPGYKNAEQYYAPFLVQFSDRERWIAFTTTSCRTDRIKGQQWDADRLKSVDPSIARAVLVYPNNPAKGERELFVRQREKYRQGEEYSRIDDVVPIAEFIRQVSGKSAECYADEVGEFRTLGKGWDLAGKNFERTVAGVLSDRDLLDQYNDGSCAGGNLRNFAAMMKEFGVAPGEAAKVEATSDKKVIGYLPASGGSPKTDVIAKISLRGGGRKTVTISCKRSKHSRVSVHQYSAASFAAVLNDHDMRLRQMLETFQVSGASKYLPAPYVSAFQRAISPYVEKLCRWAIGGYGGDGDPKRHFAEFLVTYRADKDKFSVHSVDDYVSKLLAVGKGQFGTPFMWTYAHGAKGKSIQLKVPLL